MRLSLCLLLLFTTRAWAQDSSGVLQGTISDDTDAVLPGVTVTLTNQATNRVISVAAGSYGNYSFRKVDPGRYSAVFELAGFSRTSYPDINILSAQTLRLDVRLKPGPVTTTVQVVDVAPMIDLESSAVVHHVPQDEFDRLPKSRTFQSLAVLSPTVNAGELEGGIQISGASGAENAFVIDGVNTTSAIDGRSRQNAVFEYLSEVEIKTAGIGADEAGALGGVVSAVTRSGGSQFHGNAWFYYGGDSLTAAPVRRLVLDPTDNRTVGYFQDEKSPSRVLEPGFSLGGPIKANKLFFFTSWSPRWSQQDVPYNFSNGAEQGTIRREQTFLSGFNKVSFEPSQRIRGHLSWLWSPITSEGALPVYNGACANCISSSASSNAVNSQRGSFNPQTSYGGSVEFAVSPGLLVSTRINYFWDNYKDTGIPDITSVQYQSPALGPLVPSNLQGPVGFQNTPRTFKAEHDRISRTTAQIDAAFRASFFGEHDLKAGFGVEKAVNDVNRYYPGGYVLLWWDKSFAGVAGVPDRGTYGYYEVNDFRTLGSTGSRMKSLYGQDRWHIGDHLTLNLGVRMETEQVPSFSPQIQQVAFEFGWKDRLAPRFGASYDLFGDGKVRLFGSWGRYIDWTKFDLARTVFGAEIWKTYYRSLDTLDVFSLGLGNMPGRDLWNPGVTAFRDRRSVIAGLRSVDPALKPTSQDQWSVGADYQWRADTVVGARYVHQSLRRAVEDLAVLAQGNASYIYANPGEGLAVSAPFTTGLTARPLAYPKPERNYDAVEITFRRRFSKSWFGNFSYTWSRLFGNYPGLASSDEILTPTTGLSWATAQQAGGSIAHPARYASLAWDLDEVLFDSKGHLDVRGPLATDRPHVLKWNGGYRFNPGPFGATDIGAFFIVASGTPLSTRVNTTQSVSVFVNGRGDMGRTSTLSTTDLQVAHTINVSERQTVRVEFNVLNAFNQKTARHRFDNLNRGAGTPVGSSAINLTGTDLRSGYDYEALIRATPDGANAFDPRYGEDDLFNEGLSARLGLKWSF
jgi:Carboxypeptidase regulatory-like domain/TonB dependent receptor-like, beta-barrel